MDQNPGRHPAPRTIRVGHGYDLHRLEPIAAGSPARTLVIGGVRIDHDRGPVGHSDGDALLHAATDAILGALALPDIGQLFPDDDPRHEGADSAIFLEEAVRRMHELGWRVENIDCTVVLERPKIGPLKQEMRHTIARLLGVDEHAVNVKGKTHERVDAVGEGRAIEAHAVVLLSHTGETS